MPANHLKGSKLLPAPYVMGAVPAGFKSWVNLRSIVPPPLLDGGQMTQVDYLAMWTAWVAAFTAPKMALYKAPTIQLPATSDVTVLTEPVGTWYTAGGVVAVLTGPWLNPDGTVEVGTNSHTWVYSGVSPAETIYGVWLNDVF
jgi:hypothetical protein